MFFEPEYIDLDPRCPTILHYGDADTVVPMAEVQKIHARHPSVDIQIYPGAVHAFENPDQESHNAAAAELAPGKGQSHSRTEMSQRKRNSTWALALD